MNNSVSELAGLLRAQDGTAIEMGGDTALFEAISRSSITAEILSGGRHELDAHERHRLQPGTSDIAYDWWGIERTARGELVTEFAAVLLPRRFPGPSREPLGISPSGTLRKGPRRIPLTRALRGFGVRREQAEVSDTPGACDASGAEQVIRTETVLRMGTEPLALVTARIYREFLDRFPPPWHLPAGLREPYRPVPYRRAG